MVSRKTTDSEARYPEVRKKVVGSEGRKGQRKSQKSLRAREGLPSLQTVTNGDKKDSFPGPDETRSSLCRDHYRHQGECCGGGESMRVDDWVVAILTLQT